MDFKPLFEKAKARGVEALQVHHESLEEINFDVFKGDLDKHKLANTERLVIKGIVDGKMGETTTERIHEAYADEWVQAIIDSAKAVESEDEVFIYEGDSSYPELEGLKNADLDRFDNEEKQRLTFDLEKKVKALDERIDISQAFFGESKKRVHLINSKGLNLERKVHSAILGASVVVREDDDTRDAFEYIQSNVFDDFDLDAIAEDVVQRATSLLGAKAIPSGTYDIVLENRASANLLQTFAGMFNAESVQKGMSKLKGKIGDVIAAEELSVVDDPFRAKSTKSATFDDEGVATSRKRVIDEGKLSTYLYDLKTAAKDNTESTGNAFSGNISPTNFYIEPGNLSFEDAKASLDKGLIITSLQGLHSGANPVSADFSLQASGYYVENGEIQKAVSLITVSGNYLSFLQQVVNICDDLRFNFSYVGSPSLYIKDVVISGT